jgi:hypothetical protein
MRYLALLWLTLLPLIGFDGYEQSIFPSYQQKPEQIYENQIFQITLKALIAREDFDEIRTDFHPSNTTQILNPDAKWEKIDNAQYQVSYYVKSIAPTALLPQATISLVQNEIIIESELLNESPIDVIALNHGPKSSGVIAKSLHVKRFKTSRFDDSNLIMVLDIEGIEANFEDFKLSGFSKQGLDSLEGELPKQDAFYFVVFDDHLTKIEFSYFNLEKNRFETITLPVELDEDDLSTQIGLNPKESPFELYKNIVIGVSIIILILFFAIRRKVLYLILGLILGAYYLYTISPFNTITIAKESRLRIVPTEKSTIFYTTDRVLQVERLGSRGNYIKVLLPTGEIGWIKEENVISN